LGTRFFSHRSPGQTGDASDEVVESTTPIEGRDRQQALVLDALRRADGAPVSFAELRAAGVELPASVVSELELAGVAVQRCVADDRGSVGVRLDPANERAAQPPQDPLEPPTPREAEPESEWGGVQIHHASSLEALVLGVLGWLTPRSRKGEGPLPEKRFRVNPSRRVLALTALVVGIALVFAVVAISGAAHDRRRPAPIAKQPPARVTVAASGRRPQSAPRPTQPTSTVPVSPVLAAELESQGHDLLEAGRYSDAVPVLKRAVIATGETLSACLEPADTTCLTYAYALYDLGRAERLDGEPQAAVPILERRLQIDNQRSTVGAELQLARQGIG
jgi:hypothetical protein